MSKPPGRRTIARIRQDPTGVVRVQYENGHVAELTAEEGNALLALLATTHREDRRARNPLDEEVECAAEKHWQEVAAMAVKRGVVWREVPKKVREFYRDEARKALS